MSFHPESDDGVDAGYDLIQESQLQGSLWENKVGSEAATVQDGHVRITLRPNEVCDEVTEGRLLCPDSGESAVKWHTRVCDNLLELHSQLVTVLADMLLDFWALLKTSGDIDSF